MILNDKIIELLNYRANQEELSARIYKSMSIFLEYQGFIGAAKLWNKYSEEEHIHANKAYKYLLSLDVLPEVRILDQILPSSFTSFEDVIQKSYDHEVEITEQCNKLAAEALSSGDFTTLQFAQWYLNEQVEELDKTKIWVDKLTTFGNSKTALRLLDIEMGNCI